MEQTKIVKLIMWTVKPLIGLGRGRKRTQSVERVLGQLRCPKLLCRGLVCGNTTREQRRAVTSAFVTTAKSFSHARQSQELPISRSTCKSAESTCYCILCLLRVWERKNWRLKTVAEVWSLLFLFWFWCSLWALVRIFILVLVFSLSFSSFSVEVCSAWFVMNKFILFWSLIKALTFGVFAFHYCRIFLYLLFLCSRFVWHNHRVSFLCVLLFFIWNVPSSNTKSQNSLFG